MNLKYWFLVLVGIVLMVAGYCTDEFFLKKYFEILSTMPLEELTYTSINMNYLFLGMMLSVFGALCLAVGLASVTISVLVPDMMGKKKG